MKASDFYFHVEPASKNDIKAYGFHSYVAIVKVDFWNKKHHLSDKHIESQVKDFLPSNIHECEESIFTSDKSVEETKKQLIEAGFLENSMFSKFIATHPIN